MSKSISYSYSQEIPCLIEVLPCAVRDLDLEEIPKICDKYCYDGYKFKPEYVDCINSKWLTHDCFAAHLHCTTCRYGTWPHESHFGLPWHVIISILAGLLLCLIIGTISCIKLKNYCQKDDSDCIGTVLMQPSFNPAFLGNPIPLQQLDNPSNTNIHIGKYEEALPTYKEVMKTNGGPFA